MDFVDNLNIDLDYNPHLKAKVKLQKLRLNYTASRAIPSQFAFWEQDKAAKGIEKDNENCLFSAINFLILLIESLFFVPYSCA